MRRLFAPIILVITMLFFFGCEEESTTHLSDNDAVYDNDIVDTFTDETDKTDEYHSDGDLIDAVVDRDTVLFDVDKMDTLDELVDKDILPADEDERDDADVDAGYPYGDIPIASCNSYTDAFSIGQINDPQLTEMSGFAISLKNNGVIWTHNDSGSPAEIFALNKNREILGKVILTGADAEDWEDIAIGRCGNDECIYIADTGDNLKKRTNLKVYRFIEPKIDVAVPFGEMAVSLFETFPFSYPDAKQDCEAIALNKEGELYLFTKDIAASLFKSKTFIYKFPVLADGVFQTLISLGSIETGINLTSQAPQYAVTAATIDRTGTRLLLRMYSYLWEFKITEGELFETIFTKPHTALTPGNELQGESVDYDPYSGHIFHTSELVKGITPVLYELGCK